jgi:hypothetical protein
LEALELAGTRITDAGVDHLVKMTKLRLLAIYDTGITDEGALRLKALTNLTVLELGPNVSKLGASELKKLLPNCSIMWKAVQGAGAIESIEAAAD